MTCLPVIVLGLPSFSIAILLAIILDLLPVWYDEYECDFAFPDDEVMFFIFFGAKNRLVREDRGIEKREEAWFALIILWHVHLIEGLNFFCKSYCQHFHSDRRVSVQPESTFCSNSGDGTLGGDNLCYYEPLLANSSTGRL